MSKIRSAFKVGTQWEMKNGGIVEVKEYNSSTNIVVEFLDTGYRTAARSSHLSQGLVRDPYIKNENGFYMGDKYHSRLEIDGTMKKSGLSTPINLWRGIEGRVYTINESGNNRTYIENGVTVDERFKSYEFFYEWMKEQPNTCRGGWHLDKDLLSGTIYSPETCVFLPPEINIAMQYRDTRKRDSGMPVGVRKSGVSYTARLRKNDKERHLGSFPTPEAAYEAYCNAKEEWVRELAQDWKEELPESVYESLMVWKIP